MRAGKVVSGDDTTLKELSTCCIIVLSFSSSTICSTTFEKGGNIYDDTSPVLEINSHNNIMQIIQNKLDFKILSFI